MDLHTYPQIWRSQISCIPASTNPILLYAHRCTRCSTLLLKLSAPMQVLETGQQITEKYLKTVIKKFWATDHVSQRDIIQYRSALTDQIQEIIPFPSLWQWTEDWSAVRAKIQAAKPQSHFFPSYNVRKPSPEEEQITARPVPDACKSSGQGKIRNSSCSKLK